MPFVCDQEIPIRSRAMALDCHACLRLSRQLLSGRPKGPTPSNAYNEPLTQPQGDTERMAPQVGLEPTTLRLTAGCSAIELLRSVVRHARRARLLDYHSIPLRRLSQVSQRRLCHV